MTVIIISVPESCPVISVETRRTAVLKVVSNLTIRNGLARAKLSTVAPSGNANDPVSLHISGARMRDRTINGGLVSRSTVNRQRVLHPWWTVWSLNEFLLCFCFSSVFEVNNYAISPMIYVWRHPKCGFRLSLCIDLCVLIENQGVTFCRKM